MLNGPLGAEPGGPVMSGEAVCSGMPGRWGPGAAGDEQGRGLRLLLAGTAARARRCWKGTRVRHLHSRMPRDSEVVPIHLPAKQPPHPGGR
jgi:hypothetical protein